MQSTRIESRILEIRSLLPEGVELVAVSKFQPVDSILDAYKAGQRKFGESRVQELVEKIPLLPADIRWHFIGHLQTNKVRPLIGRVSMIESVDSIRLLDVIEAESGKADTKTEVLLQLHVALEETKFGFAEEELNDFVASNGFEKYPHIEFRGLMAMASNTDDEERVRCDFAKASEVFHRISDAVGQRLGGFNVLSMGMSGDWPLAVEEGATLIRVGSAIFGERNY